MRTLIEWVIAVAKALVTIKPTERLSEAVREAQAIQSSIARG